VQTPDAKRLQIYNQALSLKLGGERLASLTDDVESRYVLDTAWQDDDRPVRLVLGEADWTWAVRGVSVEVLYDANGEKLLEPNFGYDYAMEKPQDMLRLVGLSQDERFARSMVDREYKNEGRYWFTNTPTVYARYVSDLDDYGFNAALWREEFVDVVAARLAFDVCERIRDSRVKRQEMWEEYKALLNHATGLEGMTEGVQFLQSGSWSRSRRSSSRWSRDSRGNWGA